MTSRTLSNQQVQTLEFQTDQLYQSFRRAVETESPQDAIWNRSLFDAFGSSLKEATNYQGGFLSWNRDTQRAPIFDKYLLQYILGSYSAGTLASQVSFRQSDYKPEPTETDVTLDSLKQAIDNPKVPYIKLVPMVISLAKAQNFAGIVDAMGYVREKHQKSAE